MYANMLCAFVFYDTLLKYPMTIIIVKLEIKSTENIKRNKYSEAAKYIYHLSTLFEK